ncbi:MAG: hypothetical protein IJ863_03015 [Spirochaetales bacterium]|nr:hypothetical protein [Spirochaetales bacterium]
MKKYLLLFTLVLCLLLTSCMTGDLTYYSDYKPQSNKVYVQVNPDSNVFISESVTIEAGDFLFEIPSFDKVEVDDSKTLETITQSLVSKGYDIMPSLKEADLLAVVRSYSSIESSFVYIAFFDASTAKLLFVAEAEYGNKLTVEANVETALNMALDVVPEI